MIRLFTFFFLMAHLAPAQVVDKKNYTITYDSTSQAYKPVPDSKQLIKTGLNLPFFRQSSVSAPWKSVGVEAAIEHKIKPDISLLGALEMNYGFGNRAWLYSVDLPISVRYYFSIGRKMKKRVDPHGFFRHYVAIRAENSLFSNLLYNDNPFTEKYYRGQFVNYRTNVSKYNEAFNLFQYAYVQVGSQFKIKTNKYLDINAVVPITALIYNKLEYTLATPAYVTIKYGLFWQK
ncbi:hypothetical protein G8759_23380 [Spirosoma aureum]|uniref:DUF3575 domain-containing protein n=1 Tax=Spirosoma aureum TaxID=2692134 RepID=A0A6G9ASA5_9BACT|nr:hypothetical protein [Spirosoma aureum]QIP15357.1 hypothetical protein G8759_23380 [Spirosoma aureum]